MIGIHGELIEDFLKMESGIGLLFFQSVQDGHEGFAGFSAGLGLGTEADLAGDHKRAKVAFSEIVFGWDGAILGPME